MNIQKLVTSFPNDSKANKSYRVIRRTQKVLRNYQWKFHVSGLDQLHQVMSQLEKEMSRVKRKLKRNQLPLILRHHAPEINEVYHLFLSLKELPKLHLMTEQMVVNRTLFVYQEILDDIARNEEVLSGEYIPAQ